MNGQNSQRREIRLYQITCKYYHKVYIGQTIKKLNIREKEHFQNIRHQLGDKSLLASHVCTENHEIQKGGKLLKELKLPEKFSSELTHTEF